MGIKVIESATPLRLPALGFGAARIGNLRVGRSVPYTTFESIGVTCLLVGRAI
jgi:hypothetical protein